MPLVLRDRVKETTATTGTGTITLAGAVAGFSPFSVIGTGNTTYYAIVAQTPGAWEVGIGTYTLSGSTLTRSTVLASSNAGALVNFSAGTKDVFITYPAGRSLDMNDVGSAPNQLPLNQYLGNLAFMSSNQLVVNPASSAAPAGIGDMVFQLTNNTTLVVKVMGSDGTIRSTTLTLA